MSTLWKKGGFNLQFNKRVFLYWHAGEKSLPTLLKANLKNIRHRLNGSGWEVILLSQNRSDDNFIGNWIDLHHCLESIPKKRTDDSGNEALIGDVIRLNLLLKYGGVYFDMSTILLCSSIDELPLYKRLIVNQESTFAGYSNVTFTNKVNGNPVFRNAIDGIELGALFAKKGSKFIQMYLKEIYKYWEWKKEQYDYRDYPDFRKYHLNSKSFLNEYHVHYSIYHLMLSKYPELHSQIECQSIHMIGKENSILHGPYAFTDLFARGNGYSSASTEKLLKAFTEDIVCDYQGNELTLNQRKSVLRNMDLVIIPGYLRKSIERKLVGLSCPKELGGCFKFLYKN